MRISVSKRFGEMLQGMREPLLTNNLSETYRTFVAGFETTTTFLRWALVYMILKPQVQEKLQREIVSVIGPSRPPVVADLSNMPYTEAVMTEVFRITSFLPFGAPQCATEDVQFDGYTIPKGTEVWPLMCFHSMNAQVWGDPEVFRPERFLDKNGRLIKSWVEKVQPFSVGQRACLGKPLARMEVFIFFTTIMQHFTVSSSTTQARNQPLLSYSRPNLSR
ncbi:hypothetical protein RvY_18769-2 [Ramazzottius varieornatus]|uniref:Cytochrome P450 n=1 Tax=Ramazzottius varieornatus TaxID=947166 RepID=A0A1D1W6Z3_RAMVA|nr:hypothetical protein RvY_18769-2 [Ramazzottius varieornatus]